MPSGFGIFEKTDIKKCIENIKLNPVRIVSIPIAKVITLNQNENNFGISEENKPVDVIKNNINGQENLIENKNRNLKVLIDLNSGK